MPRKHQQQDDGDETGRLEEHEKGINKRRIAQGQSRQPEAQGHEIDQQNRALL
jgi:hypothetical protein